jgi:Na+/H+-dicarboxylate symporter
MARRLTPLILLGLVAGIIVGHFLHRGLGQPAEAAAVAGYFGIVTDVFLRLIKMIIAPLVFATLVSGIANMGRAGGVGRVALRTIAWFISASLVSLAFGLFMVNLLQPGHGLALPLPDAAQSGAVAASSLNIKDFITHLVPRSIVEAMAANEILQIVVFSVFVGIAAASLGERAQAVVALVDAVAHVMLKVTGYVMTTAPIAVFAAVTAAVTTHGLGIIVTFGAFMGGFYLTMGLFWIMLLIAGFFILGRRVFDLVIAIRGPVLLAFSTASSEAAYPRTLAQLERFGIPNRIASFVLPLGYSFNLDGTMMYCTFATMFIAQAYGISLGWEQQATMLLLLMVTSKGMAGVPRASLVVIAATLSHFHIPEAGLLLILGVDQFLDMGRSATNVLGNSVATAVVAKWERGRAAAPLPETTYSES